jgi:hypothetical protein
MEDIEDQMHSIREGGSLVTQSNGKVRRWQRNLRGEPYTISLILHGGRALFVYASDKDVSKVRWILVDGYGNMWMRYPAKSGPELYHVLPTKGAYGQNKYGKESQTILRELAEEAGRPLRPYCFA